MPDIGKAIVSRAARSTPVAYRTATVTDVDAAAGTCTLSIDGSTFLNVHWNVPPGLTSTPPTAGDIVNLLLAEGQTMILGTSSQPPGG